MLMQHLERLIRKLEQENQHLRHELALLKMDLPEGTPISTATPLPGGNTFGPDRAAGLYPDSLETDQPQQLMLRSINIFQALALSTDILIPSEDISADLQKALQLLGEAAEVSRIYLFDSSRDMNGKIILHYHLEWCAESIESFISDPDLQDFPLDEYDPEISAAMLNNDIYIINTAELPDGMIRQILEKQDILSMVHVPIFVNREFWGLIGFDECRRQRRWSQPEAAALRFAARSLGLVLELRAIADQWETSRKLAEDRAEQLKHAQAIAHIGSWHYNLAQGTCYCSDQIYHILGCSLGEIQPSLRSFISLLPPSEQQHTLGRINKDLAEKGSHEGYYQLHSYDGDKKYVYARIVSDFDQQQSLLGYSGIMQDITPLRTAEQALMESEARYRELINTLPAIVYYGRLQDPSSIFISPRCKSILGYEPEYLIENFAHKELFVHPDDLAFIHMATKEALHNHAPGWSIQYRMITAAQELKWVQDNMHIAWDEESQSTQILGVILDITERKQAEAEILQQKNLLETLLSNMPSGISAKDPQNNFCYTFFNPALEKLFGRRQKEVLGKTDFDLLNDRQAQLIYQEDKKVIELGEVLQVSEKHLLDFGVDIITDYVKIPIYDLEGHPIMLLAVYEDVTGKVKLEEQLRQAEKMQVIGQLAGGIAHDFNNQLMGILGYAELLQNKTHDPLLIKYAGMITSAARHSADLTQQLLTFARKGKLMMTYVDIHSLIGDTVSLLQHTLDRRINMEVDLEVQNPIVKGDPGQLQNALLNICLNSRDAMPRGGTIRISTRVSVLDEPEIRNILARLEPGPYLSLTVTDTGSGMDEKTISRIFEPFFSTKETGKGTGMGLSTVFGTITSHKGGIKVESRPGQGTSFHIYLPFTSSHCPAPDNTASIKEKERRSQIVIIDDDLVIRELFTDLLKDHGYEVISFADGKNALNYYRKNGSASDLILLDMIMPGMDGSEVFHQLRHIQPRVRVLLITGYSCQEEIDRLIKLGAMGYIPKPVSPQILLDKISEALRLED